jgi:transcriptional regulator with XRE-family HTH domain
MNDIGRLIEEIRLRLGLSRADLARRVGVTVQTILNLERDPDYNLGLRLLRQLEAALHGEFDIRFTEGEKMKSRIRMGNDEFILYIRKTSDCQLINTVLGKRIWIWLRDNADGVKLVEDQPCRWGSIGGFIGERGLPKTATQFEFRTDALPDLYRFLDQLAQEPAETAPLDPTAQLSNYRVGEYALVMDLLGTAVRMSDPVKWFDALLEILNSVVDALNATTSITAPEASIRLYQHGDTIVVPSNEPGRLVQLGKLLVTSAWSRNVLTQAAVAGGGVFFITDPGGFGTRKPLQPNANLQMLVGPAVARGHLALSRVKGPRLLIDNETVHVPPGPPLCRRYAGEAIHRVEPGAGLQVSEFAWWEDLLDVEEELAKRTRAVESEISEARLEMPGSAVKELWERDLKSLEKRLEHLQAFAGVLADDPF